MPESSVSRAASFPTAPPFRSRSCGPHRGTRVVTFALLISGIIFLGGALPSALSESPLDSQRSASTVSTIEGGSAKALASNRASSTAASEGLAVTSSNATTLAGDPVTFTASAPGGASSYTWSWGDGTQSTTSTATASHTYGNPGIYYVLVNATSAGGATQDNLGSLLRLPVLSSYADDSLGNLVQVSGSVSANSSTTVDPQSVIAPGGSVVVSNWISREPTSPFTETALPSYELGASALPYASLSQSITGSSGLDGITVSFDSATPTGLYELNFSVASVDSELTPALTAWSNFTFSVAVGNGAATPDPSVATSPDPGTLNVYTVDALCCGETLDPQAEYVDSAEDVDAEVYQTLLVYNGSQAGPDPQDFVPDLATCVPGSAQCTALYGTDLLGTDTYTFVIDPNAQFYNASTGAHWAVHPDDIAFSLVRECLYATYPGWVVTWGWMLCEALLPGLSSPVDPANASWDGGLHAPVNNTPSNLLSAITVNNTAYCSAPMMNGVLGGGCITLNTSLSSQAWPEFLEFVTASSGGLGVVPCSWMAENGEGLPGWIDPAGGCEPAPPGRVGNPNGTPPAQAWDPYMLQDPFASSGVSSPLNWHTLGSGPYAMTSFNNVTGLTLKANPYWGGTDCLGGLRDGCLPSATPEGGSPSYLSTVNVHYESTPGPGLAAMAAGTADLADAGSTANDSQVLSLLQRGEVSMESAPTIDEYFSTFALNYSPVEASWFAGFTPTLPSDALQDLDLRGFLAATFPHQEVQSSYCEPDGLQYCFQYGGAIPALMGIYYPSNVSWDLTDPVDQASVVHSAAWWWSALASDDFIGKVCRVATPCTFPIFVVENSSYSYMQAWASEIQSLSGGALEPAVTPMPYVTLLTDCYLNYLPASPCPVAWAGWLPDYFDPSDYTDSQLLSGGVWAGETDLYGGMSGNMSACAGTFTDPLVSQDCQGTALQAMQQLVGQADGCAPPACSSTQRALLYDMAENIEEELGISVASYQSESDYLYAPWIDSTTLGYNPEINSAGTVDAEPYYQIGYLGTVPKGYQLDLTPLSAPSTGTSAFTTETGVPFLLLVAVTGGAGGYQFTWNGLPGGCSSEDTAALWCTPTATGAFSVNVLVTDTAGDAAVNAPLAVTIVPSPSITSFTSSPAYVDLGGSVTLSVEATGGLRGLQVAYEGLPPGCSSSNVTRLSCTPSADGEFSIGATVTDGRGLSAFATTSLTVNASLSGAPTLSRVGLSPATGSLRRGGDLAITAVALDVQGVPLTDGTSYLWSLFPAGAGSFNSTTGPDVTFRTSEFVGAVLVEVNVTYGGRSVMGEASLTVSAPPASSSTLSSILPYALAVGAAIGGILVGVLIGVSLRKRPRGPGGASQGNLRSEGSPTEDRASDAGSSEGSQPDGPPSVSSDPPLEGSKDASAASDPGP